MRHGLLIVKMLIALAALAAALWTFRSAQIGALALIPQVTVDQAELEVGLHRTGLTPEAMAAAGLSASDASAIVGAMITEIADAPQELSGAYDAVAEARRNHDALARLVRAGGASADEVAALQAAKSTLVACKQQCGIAQGNAFDAGTDACGESDRTMLARLLQNREQWKLPIEYLTVDWTQAEFVRIRDALANEKIAGEDPEEEPDAELQAFLAEVRAHPDVAAARANLDANLAAIQGAWEDAVSP